MHDLRFHRRFLALWVAVAAATCAGRSTADEFLLGGIQVHEPDHAVWVDSLRRAGMNTVSVTVYAHQGDWDTDHLWWDEEQPAVIHEIRAAKAAGLRVVLILRVAIDHAFPRNEFIWHGMIMPASDGLIDSWFHRYRRFVVKWAAIAEAEGVDVLGVGSEMNALDATLAIGRIGNLKNYQVFCWYHRSYRNWLLRHGEEIERRHLRVRGRENYDTLRQYLDRRFEVHRSWARQVYLRDQYDAWRKINRRRARIEGHWVRLIDHVRAVYGGRLTYAANFDSYAGVGFWEHLDILGINAYFPLRDDPDRERSPAEQSRVFERRWAEILDRVERFKTSQGVGEMPVLFTELGYTRRRHTTVQPWSHGTFSIVGWKTTKRLLVWDEQPFDPGERTRAVEALHAVHRRRGGDPLTGILYWKLSTVADHAAIEPFLLHVGGPDPLQKALATFVGEDPSAAVAGSRDGLGDRASRFDLPRRVGPPEGREIDLRP